MDSGEKYDLVLFAHCLEHLDEPSVVMNRISDLVNDDGLLHLEVPIVGDVVNWMVEAQRNGAKMLKDAKS